MTYYSLIQFLIRSKSKIWRRILVPSNPLLPDLHRIIQTTMGWTNSHLHQFVKEERFYKEWTIEDDFWDTQCDVDYKNTKISDLFTKEKEQIIYEYDFGNGWEHDLILEKIHPFDDKTVYPVCLDGKLNCPPEDCGGIWGYYNMLEILRQADHEEYDSYIEWLGGETAVANHLGHRQSIDFDLFTGSDVKITFFNYPYTVPG